MKGKAMATPDLTYLYDMIATISGRDNCNIPQICG
jgi:hypothetical protein